MALIFIPKIQYGRGALSEVDLIEGERVMAVYDNESALELVLPHIGNTSMETRVFRARPDMADPDTVMEGAKAMMELKPDWVAAIGGHGALDCAKLMRVFYERPELSFKELISGAEGPELRKTQFAALPLLNTNGGEVSRAAAIDLPSGGKPLVQCPGLLPQRVIIDPAALACSNEADDARAALSAMTLAIESAAAPDADCFSRPLALEGLRLAIGGISPYSGLSAAREKLLYAQCLAGIAHSCVSPGLCCAMISASSGYFGSRSFGQLGAIYLPQIIRAASGERLSRYDAAAKSIGLSGGGALCGMISEYADMLGLSPALEELGLDKNTFLKKLSPISQRTARTPGIAGLLPENAQEQIELLFRSSYSG